MEARREMKLRQTPRLIVLAVVWSAALTAVALMSPLLRRL